MKVVDDLLMEYQAISLASAGSTGARWMIDIAGNTKNQGANPKLPRVELKFR